MKSIRLTIAALLTLCLAAPVLSATEIMKVSELKKGMKGYGETVFEGNKLERFDVEVLGVLDNFGPRQDMILIRVLHPLVQKTGIIAGMSGSPIYIDGKLIGALAYGWAFATDPIAGVTPIEEMLAIGKSSGGSGSARAGAAPLFSAAEFAQTITSGNLTPAFERMTAQFAAGSAARASALPLTVPMSVSGLAPDTLTRFGGVLEQAHFMAVPSGSSAATSRMVKVDGPAFRPGDACAGMLVDGDISVAATGTITHVDGDTVYAFGHPFLDMGQISFPLAQAEVITVMPNLNRSVKISNNGAVVGTMTEDRFAGTMGIVGREPRMIPVELTVNGGATATTYNVGVVPHPQLAPLMLAMVADTVIANTQRAAGERTLVMESEIAVKGMPKIAVREGWAGAQARSAIPMYLALVSSYLMSNEFNETEVQSIKVKIHHADDIKIAKLIDASVESPEDGEINPGDTVRVRATLKPFRGESFTRMLDVKVPSDQKPGKGYVYVGSGGDVNRLDFSLIPPAPQNLQQLVGVIERLRPSTDLVAGLYARGEGAIAAGVFLPNLPPSMRAILEADSSNSPRAVVRYHPVGQLAEPLDYVIEGALKIDLNIVPRS